MGLGLWFVPPPPPPSNVLQTSALQTSLLSVSENDQANALFTAIGTPGGGKLNDQQVIRAMLYAGVAGLAAGYLACKVMK